MAELDQNLPFKKEQKQVSHPNVGRIPSVKDSGTGARHGADVLGSLLETGAQGMNVRSKAKKHAHHSQKYYEDIDSARR